MMSVWNTAYHFDKGQWKNWPQADPSRFFSESDTNLFHIHFRVFRARNTVAPDINEVMEYNSHAPQERPWHSNIWQPAWQAFQGCLRLKFGNQTFIFLHLLAIWWKCLPKTEWDLSQGGPVQESTIDSDGHWQVGTVCLKSAGVSVSALTVTKQKVCPLGTGKAEHWTPRIAARNDWLFYYEWCHSGNQKANV